MSVKERILAIRLMEKLQSRPDFAKALKTIHGILMVVNQANHRIL